MLQEDIRECESCGAEIVHLIVAGSTPWRNDPDYNVCAMCVEALNAPDCMSAGCAMGNCDGCTDVDANCCECSCHHG